MPLDPFAPEGYEAGVRLLGREAGIHLVPSQREQADSLTIHGPLRLKVRPRLDFGPINGTTQAYVIKVSKDGPALEELLSQVEEEPHGHLTRAAGGHSRRGPRRFLIRRRFRHHALHAGCSMDDAPSFGPQIHVPAHELTPPAAKRELSAAADPRGCWMPPRFPRASCYPASSVPGERHGPHALRLVGIPGSTGGPTCGPGRGGTPMMRSVEREIGPEPRIRARAVAALAGRRTPQRSRRGRSAPPEPRRSGTRAPDFTLPYATADTSSSRGSRWKEAVAKGPVILAFYPADLESGVHREVCTFRDSFTDLSQLGMAVWGIRGDQPFSHKAWPSITSSPSVSSRILRARGGEGVTAASTTRPGSNRRTVFVVGTDGKIGYADTDYSVADSTDFHALRVAAAGMEARMIPGLHHLVLMFHRYRGRAPLV